MKLYEERLQFQMNKLQQRQNLLSKLISDCITFRLTETEALNYIEKEYGKPISSRNYYLVKSKLESEDSSQIWLDEFARIGFVQHFRKLFDDSIKIHDDSLNRLYIEATKSNRNETLILDLKKDARENIRLLFELCDSSPIIAAIKAKIQQNSNSVNCYKKGEIIKLDSDVHQETIVNSESESWV